MTSPVDMLANAPTSFGAYFRKRVQDTPNDTAYSEPDRAPEGPNTWRTYSWQETREVVDDLAAGLLRRGLKQEERVSICSSTRVEWIFLDFAIACAGGATTTVYPNTGADEVDYIVSDSDSVVFIAEDKTQVDKVVGYEGLREQVHTIVVIDPTGVALDDRVVSYEQLREIGRAHLEEHPEVVDEAIAATTLDHLSTLIYTSGTTGRPKGVRLPHRCWVYEAEAIKARNLLGPNEVMYLWLPLSHVFGKALLAAQLSYNYHAAVDGRIDRIVAGLGEVKPTVMCGAPRVFEKVRAAVLTGSGLKGKISHWAFAVGRDAAEARRKGALTGPLKLKHAIADKLVFAKLRDKLGGNIKFMISGSAKLNPQVQAWFHNAGIIVVEGYGSTESSAIATVDEPSSPTFGTVGLPVPGLETKIAEDGELLLRGPSIFEGYHKLLERTAEVLTDDGWYHTGDIAEIDADGKVRITDRKKDLFKTSGGKYVSPQKVEAAITANIPYVSQAIAVGDGQKYVSALVVMDPALLQKWAEKRNLGHLSYAELTQRPEIHDSVERQMERVNARLERWETVKKFAILDHELTVESGGTTANMKIRRSVVSQQYQDIVDGFYPKED
ncbi:AMP-dependent synthetase/ligase [Tessaracoccus oleiagri]|nr:long-chain fatty acid--CoA ligase [Tessaracoccus oleiagri]